MCLLPNGTYTKLYVQQFWLSTYLNKAEQIYIFLKLYVLKIFSNRDSAAISGNGENNKSSGGGVLFPFTLKNGVKNQQNVKKYLAGPKKKSTGY